LFSGATSLLTTLCTCGISRASMTAMPWSAIVPLTISNRRVERLGMKLNLPAAPTPAVVIKIPSPWPRPTTLVSPVTTQTPASAAVAAMESRISSRSDALESFGEDEAQRDSQRFGATDGQIVDGSADGEPADIAAREFHGWTT
jgi:hypothetical protein